MVCRGCGAPLSNNGHCSYCGIDNSKPEKELLTQEEINENKELIPSEENARLYSEYISWLENLSEFKKRVTKTLIILGIGLLIFIGYETYIDICVQQKGPDAACTMFCRAECWPPFYLTYSIIYMLTASGFVLTGVPIIIFSYLRYTIKIKSYEKKLNI